MIFVTGRRTSIVRELEKLLPQGEDLLPSIYGRPFDLSSAACPLYNLVKCERYVFAAGVMAGVPISDQPEAVQNRTMAINCLNHIAMCELILDRQPTARICLIGSESAELGSYDPVYAASKAVLHAYAKAKRLKPTQQLVCVAPPIISDAGMTLARKDYPDVIAKRRTVTSADVAKVVHRVLYGWNGAFDYEIRLAHVDGVPQQ